MLFSQVKDQKIRKAYLKCEYKKRVKKYVFINLISKLQSFKKSIKKKIQPSLYKSLYTNLFKKEFSKVSMVRRCLVNNKAGGVYKSFNLSRMIFRDLLQFGLVPGYKKAVW